MKLTFFIGGLGNGGAERVVCNLANYLAAHEHEVDILTIGDNETYFLDERIHRIKLIHNYERKNVITDTIRRFFRFLLYLRKKRDVFVVMLPFTTILLLKFRLLVRGKIIVCERSYPTYYSTCDQRSLRKLAHRADAWIFQTQSSKIWYEDFLGKARYTIIANPINERFKKDSYSGERQKLIVTAGRLISVKNHSLLLKSFSALKDEFGEYSLIIYGEGELRDTLEKEVEELGMINRVSFPGFADWGDLSSKASLFVLSSDLEGMPNALMEAMALGLPCISTDCDGGGARFLIENEKNGLLVPKGDVDALTKAMRRMLTDKELSEQCSKEAHKICERLAPERIYGEWERFIQEIINT